MSKKHHVFVYGTLRQGESNHYLLRNAQKVMEQCWTEGKLINLGPFPALLKQKGRVYGELYLVSDQQLYMLDQLEGYRPQRKQNDYERIRQLVTGDKGSYEAWVYVYPSGKKASYPIIKWGDWKCHRKLEENSEWLYFAYGSCMDEERFGSAGKDHLFKDIVGRGVARGYTFRYTRLSGDGKGRADMVEENGWVEGKVYRIKMEALLYLYHREGVKHGAYRPAFIPVKVDGARSVYALTFFVVDKSPDTEPPIEYVKEIVRGGKEIFSDRYYHNLREYHLSVFNIDIKRLNDDS